MSPARFTVRGRRVVTPEGLGPASVRVAGGRISGVDDPAGGAGGPVVDVGDAVVSPGLVDTHVHCDEPGRTHWEGFASATRAAAAGGVTTIVDMPLNSLPPTTTPEALAHKRRSARGRCFVDVGFWGGVVPGNTPQLAGLHDAGVLGFKAFLSDPGVDEFPPVDLGGLREALAELARLGALALVHAELPGPLAAAPAPHGPAHRGWLDSRPPAAEDRAVRLLADLSAELGARVHVVHVSSAGAAEPLRHARSHGLPVTAETCPHYLALAAEDVPDGATQFKCAPPIREAANRERLWAALADGAIGLVVSDHSPCPPRLKEPDFGLAWGGISSLQLGLPVVWTAARERGFTPADVCEWMSAAPARLAGLPAKGAIAQGRDADLVVWDPDATFTVDPTKLHHRHPLTPYAGMSLHGVVERTWLRGRPVGPRPAGRLLERVA